MYGLTSENIHDIKVVFSRHKEVENAILYGSRAKGNHKPSSDIDISLVGNSITLTIQLEIATQLDDLLLPYKIDLSIYHKIENKEFVEHIDRVGINFYEKNIDWKEYRFSDFALINPSVKIPKENKSSFVEMKDLTDGKRYCEPSQERALGGGSRFENGDTLFARITPCLENGKICQVRNLKNNVGFGSTEFHVLRGKENISDSNFIFYLSRWREVRDHAEKNFDGTSGRQRVPKQAFDDLILNLPSLPEQIAIASVLSSLDYKIDLLHRQNATLEKMAETLFRQWFVEEAKEEWEVIELGSVIETTSGGTPSRSNMAFYENGTINWVKSKELNGSFILETEELITEEALKKSSAKIIPINSILIAMYGATVGEYGIISKAMTCNQAVCALIPNIDYPYTFLFLFVKHNKQELINMAVGSAQQNISQLLIKQLPVLNCLGRIKEFNLIIEPNFEKIKSNQNQIRTLSQLRDNMLPKLMSGEVKVQTIK